MMKLKKAQNSVEFLIIFAFVLTLIGLVMFITGRYLVDAQYSEQQMRAEDFAENINKELAILTQVDAGYYRELMVSSDNYEILNITPSQLQIRDIYNNKTYYFDLIGNYNVSTENKTVNGREETFLVFKKETVMEDIDGITLDEEVIEVEAPVLPSNLDVVFEMGGCSDGRIELFSINDTDNAHGAIPPFGTYQYSSCIKHDLGYSLGIGCSGEHDTLFYLGDVDDSHAYTDIISGPPVPMPPGYYNWQQLCVNSSNGNVNVKIQQDQPNINYKCVGSIWVNNIMGGMLGDCSTNSFYDKIWLSVDIPNS